jgi:formylglycine-generating enzyme required for sulfatase activity
MIQFKQLFFIILANLICASTYGQKDYSEPIPGTNINIDMVFVKGGTFKMTSADSSSAGNSQVTLHDFWIGKYEITFEQFSIFQNRSKDNEISVSKLTNFKVDGVSRPTPPYEDMSFGMGTTGGFPAVSMTQQAALRYCQWLYLKTGNFYRLPTEAEWEYACSEGGKKNKHADLEEIAWFYDNSYEKFHKVGQKTPNAWNLHDMLGNVAEWTLDRFETNYYELIGAEATNPWIPPTAKYAHTVRGGSYDDDEKDCSCSVRIKSSPRWQRRDPQIPKSIWWNTDAPFVGFRVVRPTQQPSHEEIMAFFEQAIKD